MTRRIPVVAESPRLAECVGEVRLLLRQILSESGRYGSSCRETVAVGEHLRERILAECEATFTACFHAFYPTNNLKWLCLCTELMHVPASGPTDPPPVSTE